MAEDKKTDVAAEGSQPNSAENKRGRQDERGLDSQAGRQPSRQGGKQLSEQLSEQGQRKRVGRLEGRQTWGGRCREDQVLLKC
jgi:hypothetical protein